MECESNNGDKEKALLLFLLRRRMRGAMAGQWVHEIGKNTGNFTVLSPQLRSDEERFCTYFRMSIQEHDRLHELVEPHIVRRFPCRVYALGFTDVHTPALAILNFLSARPTASPCCTENNADDTPRPKIAMILIRTVVSCRVVSDSV